MIFEFLKGCTLCLELLFDFTMRCIELHVSGKLLKSATFESTFLRGGDNLLD